MGCYKCGSDKGSPNKLCPDCNLKRLQDRGLASIQLSSLPGVPVNLITIVIVLASIVAACTIAFFILSQTRGAPTIAEVQKPLEQLLLSRSKCINPPEIKSLSIKEVGPYHKGLEAYAIFTEYAIACTEGVITSTTRSHGNPKLPTAYVRREATGKLNVFVTPHIRRAEQRMRENTNDDLHKISEQLN